MINIITSLAILIGLAQASFQSITNCLQHQLVIDFYNTSEYLQICIECKQDYVLSFNMMECLSTYEQNSNFTFCKRIGRDQTCEEALCAIQLDENGKYISKQFGHPDENCARVDSKTGDCLYPRFNFSLNKQTKTISKDTVNFCAIRDGQPCQQYFSSFIPTSNGYSVFLTNFVNLEQINNNDSLNSSVVCKTDYSAVKQINSTDKYYGCVKNNFQVENCSKYDAYQSSCLECIADYSLNINGNECLFMKNCSKHINSKGCLKCNQFYYPSNGVCKKIENCVLQEDSASQMCAYCKSPYYGQLCENISKDMPDNCEQINTKGLCVSCKNNDINYYDKKNNQCQVRQFSKNCKIVNPISDQCLNFDCKEGYYFNFKFVYQYFNPHGYCDNSTNASEIANKSWAFQDSLYFDHEENVLNDFYYYYHYNTNISVEQFCPQRASIMEGCLSYDKCADWCQVCKPGYKLIQTDEYVIQNRFKNICIQEGQSSIENCIYQDSQTNKCLQCKDYYTNYSTHCQLGTVNHCLQYLDNNQCSKCEQDYVLSNYQCFSPKYCSAYILKQNGPFCSSCLEKPNAVISLVRNSQDLTSDCVLNPPNNYCVESMNNTCLKCANGYVLIEENATCVSSSQVTDFCLTANISNECQTCVSGFRLVNGKCFKVSGSCSLRYSCTKLSCEINCLGYNNTCNYSCQDNEYSSDLNCQSCSLKFSHCKSCTQLQCTQCDDGYTYDNASKICMYVCQNGTLVQDQNYCPCTNQYCNTCDFLNKNKCFGCKDFKYLQDYQCVDSCSDGYVVNNGGEYSNYCYKCDLNCDQCSNSSTNQGICYKCKQGWYLEGDKCVDKCTIGYIYQGFCVMQCPKYLLNGQCVDSCPSYSYFDDTNMNYFCIDSCPQGYYSYEDKNISCTKLCNVGYYPDDTTKICKKTQIDCKVSSCQQCDPANPNICQICNAPYYLVNSECLMYCPDGYFKDGLNICQPCNLSCLKCSSSDKCDVCKNPLSNISDNCLCPAGQKLYRDTCLDKCPVHSTQIGDNICQQDCPDGLYPIYNANKQQKICEKVIDPISPYCIQNIENIPELLNFKLQEVKSTDNSYFIIITAQQIPSLCYQFGMKGLNNYQFETLLIKEDTQSIIYQSNIPKDATQKNLLDCNGSKCTVALNIYYADQLQYVVMLSIDLNLELLLSNGIKYTGSSTTVIGVCPTCVIPSSLIVASKVAVTCSDNQNCSSDNIQATTNSLITVTQSFDDSKFSNNKIQPHSLKLEFTMTDGTLKTLFITNYFYDNSTIGKIIYSFKAVSLQSGNLIVTSVSEGAKGRRILTESSSSNVIYPQVKLALKITDQFNLTQDNSNKSEQDSDEENSSQLVYILIAIFTFIIILVLIFISYKCYMRRKYRRVQVLEKVQIDNEVK